jgi:hypothetical protein
MRKNVVSSLSYRRVKSVVPEVPVALVYQSLLKMDSLAAKCSNELTRVLDWDCTLSLLSTKHGEFYRHQR